MSVPIKSLCWLKRFVQCRWKSEVNENRVNILKKVGKNWIPYPAVIEPNGRLRDKVHVRGKIEIHPEGYHYIEWW